MRSSLRFIFILVLSASFAVSAFGSTTLVAGESVPPLLKWKAREITIAVSSSLTRPSTNIIRGSDVSDAIYKSIAAWESVANVKFKLVDSERINVSPSGIRGDGVNLITIAQTADNVLLFENDPEGVSATTRVFYNKRNAIAEADIVLNPYQQFSTNGTFGTYDLQSTLTHEIGHLLGLGHSIIPGATMFDHYGKNGLFGMPNFSARTLSSSDILAANVLYGSKEASESCCSLVSGTISKPALGQKVWIEDENTGQLLQAVDVVNSGTFEFASLNAGLYKLYAQGSGPAVNSDAFEIQADGNKTIGLSVLNSTKTGALNFIGLNGELSDQSITLNAGRTYSVYVGGQGFDSSQAKIGIDSPYFGVYKDSNLIHNYGDSFLVMSADIRVDAKTPPGLYSVYIEFINGKRYYLPGSISVESFENPWGSAN